MGQESSKSKTEMSGRNQLSVGESRRHKSPLFSMGREIMEGTSVDGSISSQVGKFKPDDIEQPEMNGQLQNTVVDKYLSLKGDIDEVKSLNSEVMEKISLLEKKSEEKKKQRALNRMQTARFREKVSKGYVQTGHDIKNKNSEETLSTETTCAGRTDIPLSAQIESPRTSYNHTEASNTVVALENKSEIINSIDPRLKGTKSDCVVTAELNNDVNRIANEEAQDVLVDSSKTDLSAGGNVASKDDESATTYSEAEKVFENASTGKDRPIAVTKVVPDRQLFNKRGSPTNPATDIQYTKCKDDLIPVKTESYVSELKKTETVEVIAENCQPLRDSKSGSEKVSMVSVDENKLNVDSDESENILDKEKANEDSMKGFAETFELTVPQREYNLMLKRTKTNEKQDNRLAFEFNLQPNSGCLYTITGPLENQTVSATCVSVKQLSHDEDRDRSTEIKQHEGTQENASKLSKDKKPTAVGRKVKPSAWKTTPTQKDKIHDAVRKPKGTDTETSSAVFGADLDQSYGLKTNIQTVQTQSAVTEGVVNNTKAVSQEQSFPEPRITSSDLPAALTPLTAQLIKQSAPQLEKMGIPLKIDEGKITVGGKEWKFDERLGKLKVENVDELKETVREAQSELEESEGDMGEEELKQFKFRMCMLELISSMCSDGGVDVIESLKTVGSLGSIENVNLAANFDEESAGHMQTFLKAASQIVKVIEPHLPATSAAASASIQSAAVKPAGHLTSTQSQQSEVKVKAVTESENVKVTESAKSASTEDKTVPSGHQSDEEEQEVILVDETQWVDAANIELQKGRRCRDIRDAGMDTIICLDVSASMKGEAWNQALGFIRGFIECIQGTTLSDGCFEHVALVTFGSETKVQQHMTCDYVEILRKLEHLKPGGPSPMFAGILMIQAAIIGAGSVFQVGGYKIHPRVFLITDGKATPAGKISGPDRCSPGELDIVFLPILSYVHTIYEELHCSVNPVPVGSFDLTLLQRLAEDTNGKMTSPEDWKRVSRTMKNLIQAAKVGSREELLGMSSLYPLLMDDGLTAEDHAEIAGFLKTHKKNESSDDEDPADTGLPPLGTRIRRTENMKGTDDAYNLGTVTKRFKDGYLDVTWDKTRPGDREHEKIPFSSGGGRNIIKITDDFRILRDELIAVGCLVKRGRDWRYQNQDGGDGNLGAVFDVNSRGIVKVRWRNGAKNTYRFGCEGKFDLEVVSPTEPGHGNVLSDHSVGGAVGWAYRSQSEIMVDGELMGSDRLASFLGKSFLDSDEEEDIGSSDSSEDIDMTLEEKMNKRNKQMSKRAYIIEPPKSEDKLSHSEREKSIENTSSGDIDNAEIDIGDTIRDQQLERHAGMLPDSFSSASQNEKKLSDNVNTSSLINVAVPISEPVLCKISSDTQQKDFEQYGTKPKQLVGQPGNKEIPPKAGNNSATALPIKGEAENHVHEVKALELFAPDKELEKDATSKTEKIFDHLQQETIGKQSEQGPYGNSSEKQEITGENLKLQLPSNTVNQQTAAINKTSDHLISSKMDKVYVDEVISQTSTTTTWCWKDSDEWRPYPSTICDKIEKSFKLKKPSALIQVNGKPYRVVFSRMEQVDINSKMAIKVQRQ